MAEQLHSRTLVSVDPIPASTRPPSRSDAAEALRGWATRWVEPQTAALFAARYTAASGVPMQVEQVLDGRTRGFWRGGRLVAGYRVAEGGGRYAALAGAEAVARWPFALEETVEITHLWIEPDLPVSLRRQVYGWMAADVLGSGKRIVLGGAIDPVAARQQMRSLPYLLEESQTSALGSLATLRVYYGTVTTMLADAVASGVPVPWLGIH